MTPPEGNISCKSPCVLSEKIDGKYVVFYRIWPDVIIDYVDDLDFLPDDKWLPSATPSIPPETIDGKCIIIHGTWPNLETEITEYTSDQELVTSERWKQAIAHTKRISARPNHEGEEVSTVFIYVLL